MSKPVVNISLDEKLSLWEFKVKIRDILPTEIGWKFMQSSNKEHTILGVAEIASDYVTFNIPEMEIILRFEEIDSVDISLLLSDLYTQGWADELKDVWGMLDNADKFDCEVEIYIKRKNNINTIPVTHAICKEYMESKPNVPFLTWVMNKYPSKYEEIKGQWEEKKKNILLSKS